MMACDATRGAAAAVDFATVVRRMDRPRCGAVALSRDGAALACVCPEHAEPTVQVHAVVKSPTRRITVQPGKTLAPPNSSEIHHCSFATARGNLLAVCSSLRRDVSLHGGMLTLWDIGPNVTTPIQKELPSRWPVLWCDTTYQHLVSLSCGSTSPQGITMSLQLRDLCNNSAEIWSHEHTLDSRECSITLSSSSFCCKFVPQLCHSDLISVGDPQHVLIYDIRQPGAMPPVLNFSHLDGGCRRQECQVNCFSALSTEWSSFSGSASSDQLKFVTGCSKGLTLWDGRKPTVPASVLNLGGPVVCCDADGTKLAVATASDIKRFDSDYLETIIYGIPDPTNPTHASWKQVVHALWRDIQVKLPTDKLWWTSHCNVFLLSSDIQIRDIRNGIIDIIKLSDIEKRSLRIEQSVLLFETKKGKLYKFRTLAKVEEALALFEKVLDDLASFGSNILRQFSESDFQKIGTNPIGTGTFGSVWQAECKPTKLVYALKYLNGNDRNEMSEIHMLSQIHHKFILKCLGFFQTHERKLCIITEFIEGGNLENYLYESTKYHLAVRQMAELACNISEGMRYLHEQNMLHRDLKPSNILIQKWHSYIKICDFGQARILLPDQSNGRMTMGVGTQVYNAPEITTAHYDFSVDVYSFGLMLWEIHTRTRVWSGFEDSASIRDQRPPIQGNMNPVLTSIMQECWNANPLLRPTFANIVERLTALISGDGAKPTADLSGVPPPSTGNNPTPHVDASKFRTTPIPKPGVSGGPIGTPGGEPDQMTTNCTSTTASVVVLPSEAASVFKTNSNPLPLPQASSTNSNPPGPKCPNSECQNVPPLGSKFCNICGTLIPPPVASKM
ncbi:TKL family protein kinase [Pelomyxa schiedti]|nr:TKL family protein kinase [Pelomyxa schiedti]